LHALFPGTFDPVTLGHVDILERARRLFSRVTIAVASHPEKQHLFTLEERLDLLERVTRGMQGVSVTALPGLVVRGCKDLGANVIVRGLRTAGDLEYERQMALTNRVLLPEVETLFLLPAADYASISSTLVRQVARMGGDCSPFVPPAVAAVLEQRFARRGSSSERTVVTPDAPRPSARTRIAIRAGGLVHCSGQIALDPATGQLVAGGAAAQTSAS
jgi:pantetheine-phosphate adenylyltransferase